MAAAKESRRRSTIRSAPAALVDGAMIVRSEPPNGVRGPRARAAEAAHDRGHLRRSAVRRGLAACGIALGRKDDAGDGIASPRRIATDLARAPSETAHVVQSGLFINERFLTEAIGGELRLDEGVELEQQHVDVERLGAQLPGSGGVRFQAFRTIADRRRRRHHDRHVQRELWVLPKSRAELHAANVRHAGVDDVRIGLRDARQLESALASPGPKHGVAARTQDALQ